MEINVVPCRDVLNTSVLAQPLLRGLKRGLCLTKGNFLVCRKAPKTYEPLQKELLDNEVPFNIVKVVAFMDRVEVKDALAYLRLMLNTRDDPAFERVFNKPKRGLGELLATAVTHSQ